MERLSWVESCEADWACVFRQRVEGEVVTAVLKRRVAVVVAEVKRNVGDDWAERGAVVGGVAGVWRSQLVMVR